MPAFSAAGTGSETAPAWPAHSAGDFGLLVVEHPTVTISTPAGWTALTGMPVVHTTTAVRLSVFYKFATSGAEAAPSISNADHCWGVILTFTGVNTLNPIHLLAIGDNVNATSQCAPGLTTTLDDCMVVCAFAYAADDAGPLSSGETNSTLASVTERYDAGTITGNGGGLVVITGELASKGSFAQTEATLSTSSASAVATIVLQASDQAFGQKGRIVNTRM